VESSNQSKPSFLRSGNAGVKTNWFSAFFFFFFGVPLRAETTRRRDLVLPYSMICAMSSTWTQFATAGSSSLSTVGWRPLCITGAYQHTYGLDIDVVNPQVYPTFSFMTRPRRGGSAWIALVRTDGWACRPQDRYRFASVNDADADRHGHRHPGARSDEPQPLPDGGGPSGTADASPRLARQSLRSARPWSASKQ